MGKLIRNQVADKNGKTIPTTVASGTYELRSLTNTPKEGLFEGKLVVDKTYGHAAHGCMVCCGYPGKGFMYPNPFNFDLLWYYFDNAYMLGTNACSGQDDDITSYYPSWWTGNTQVATADMNQITAVGVGSTSNFGSGTIPTGGDWESRHCPNSADQASGGVNVGPYQIEPINTNSQGPVAAGSCPTNQYPGFVKYVTNQVQYRNGSAYAVSGLSVADTITVGTPHDLGSGTSTGTGTTTGDGSFQDQYSVCSPACPGSSGETDALQNWTVNGVPLPHVNGVVYKCTSITIDGN